MIESSSNRIWGKSILFLSLFLASYLAIVSVHSQSNPCPGTPPPLMDPAHPHPIFKAGANVFVMYDSSLSQTQINQAKAGFQSWNNAGAVYFQDDNPNTDAIIYVTNGTLSPSVVSNENYQAAADGTIEILTITFNTNAATVSNTNSDPYYDDRNQATTQSFKKTWNTEWATGSVLLTFRQPLRQRASRL